MARRKTPKDQVNVHEALSRRLREIRQELFGDHGGPELARRLNLPARTWYNYETGVTIPAEVLLNFIDQTGANPRYLVTGEGPRFRRSDAERPVPELSPTELIRRGLERLERASTEAGGTSSGDLSADYAAVDIYPLARIGKAQLDRSASEGQILALRQWLTNPSQTIAVRLIDDAMQPILPRGSIGAIDRSLTDPLDLQGQIVAARPDGIPVIRWLEISGRHMILRPNNPSRDFPLVPIEINRGNPSLIIGPVVCSWSRFRER